VPPELLDVVEDDVVVVAEVAVVDEVVCVEDGRVVDGVLHAMPLTTRAMARSATRKRLRDFT